MAEWSFLTNHARALVCIARDPGVRLREIAAELGVTERCAFGIVNDLSAGGYLVKEKDGRRNRYRLQRHLPLPLYFPREPTIGEVLAVLVDPATPAPAQTADGDGGSGRRNARGTVRRTSGAKRKSAG
jgi:DNA-binding IscR family transcriptional regulator